MSDFHEQDLSGARFHHVRLEGAVFDEVLLNGAQVRGSSLADVLVKGTWVDGLRLRGVEGHEVQVSGDIERLLVNGVEVMPLVEAELDRLDPDRVLLRSTDAGGLRRGWDVVQGRWDALVERARVLPPELLHESVDGEWSFIQTLRHLGFATATWLGLMIHGERDPWRPLDLPWDEAPGWPGVPWHRDARPTLAEALAARTERQAQMRDFLAALTDDDLQREVSSDAPGAPPMTVSVGEAVRIVLNEEYQHHRFAVRDLDLLTSSTA